MFSLSIPKPPSRPSFDDYIDMYSTLNHLLHTKPVNTQLQLEYFNNKNSSYSMKRNKIHICNRQEEIKQNSAKNSGFAYSIFETNHSIYPRMKMKQSVFNQSLSNLPINLLIQTTSVECYLRGFYKWGHNYFHFITECLPSILFLKKQLPHFPIICLPSSFCRPLLEFMNVNNPVIHELPSAIDVCFEQLYVECGNPSPEKIQLLRDVIEQKITFEPTYGVLIHRKESIRSLTNHDEVLQMLRETYPHIEWRVFGSETIANTVELFRKAKIIVAPHGAGSTNMIFSARGIHVVEFMPVDSPNICYWHLSEALGNTYHMIACDSVNQQMSVNVAETRDLLRDIINALV